MENVVAQGNVLIMGNVMAEEDVIAQNAQGHVVTHLLSTEMWKVGEICWLREMF